MTAPKNLCLDAGLISGVSGGFPLQGTIVGDHGVYSGPGVIDDGNGQTFSYDASLVGLGRAPIFYTYTDNLGCIETAIDSVTIINDVQLNLRATAFCIDACIQIGLTGGNPIGGVYSGNGVIDDGNGITFSFDPEAAGVGAHAIYYEYEDEFGCTMSELDFMDVVDNCSFCPGEQADEVRFSIRRIQLLGCSSPTEGANPQLKINNITNGNLEYYFGYNLDNNQTHSTIFLEPICTQSTIHDIGIEAFQTAVDLDFQSAEIEGDYCEEFDGEDTNVSNIIAQSIDLTDLTLFGAIGGEVNFIFEGGCLKYDYVIMSTSCDESTCQLPEIVCPANNYEFNPECNDESIPAASVSFNDWYCPNPDSIMPTVYYGCGNLTLESNDTSYISGCTKILERTYTVTDENGDQASCVQSFTLPFDDVLPLFDSLPADQTLAEEDIPDAFAMTATDNCTSSDELSISFSENQVPAIYPIAYALLRSWTVTDNCGNTSTHTQEIQVLSTDMPTIVCPEDITVQIPEQVSPDSSLLTVNNYCITGYSIDINNTLIDTIPSIPEVINYHFEFVFNNDCGETLSCTQVITYAAPAPGQITCPEDITVDVIADFNADPLDATVVNYCDSGYDLAIQNILIDGVPEEGGTIYHYEYTMSDPCGGEESCIQLVTLEDDNSVPYSIVCPSAITVNCVAEINPTIAALMIDGFCESGYEISMSDPEISGAPTCTGTTYDYTFTLKSECGDSVTCHQLYTLQNDIPEITCPADKTVFCASEISVDYTDLLISTDCNLNYNLAVDSQLVEGVEGCNGAVYNYKFMLADECGNSNACEQRFTIEHTPLELICPPDITLTCGSSLDDLAGDIQVSTNCDLGYSVTTNYTLLEGQAACAGAIYNYVYTVTEDCGAQSICSRQVVLEQNDFMLILPEEISVSCASEINPTTDQIQVLNACTDDYSIEITLNNIFGTPNCPGTKYLYDYTYSDACLFSEIAQQVYVVEESHLNIILPTLTYVDCYDDIVVGEEDAQILSTCEIGYSISIEENLPDTDANCGGAVYEYTYFYEDECGQSTSASRYFILKEDNEFSIEAPQDVTVACEDEITDLLSEGIVHSNCNVEVNTRIELVKVEGEKGCPGTQYKYAYTANSVCGDEGTDFRIITIENEKPEIHCPGTLTINCSALDDDTLIQEWLASAYVSEACKSMPEIKTDFDLKSFTGCGLEETYTVRFFFEDVCGRSNQCNSQIILEDNSPPIIYSVAQDFSTICDEQTESVLLSWLSDNGGAIVLDDCWGDKVFWTTIPENPLLECNGEAQVLQVEFIAQDLCGNASSTTANFYVAEREEEIEAPEPEPTQLSFSQNYPDPFSEETQIDFYIPTDETITFNIFNASGHLVYQETSEYLTGYHTFKVKAYSLKSTGVFICQIQLKDVVFVQKMLARN